MVLHSHAGAARFTGCRYGNTFFLCRWRNYRILAELGKLKVAVMNRYSDQPDIMAIGDSMYQGIRSFSFLPAMAQHSAPKQIADALGMAMVVPDLQRVGARTDHNVRFGPGSANHCFRMEIGIPSLVIRLSTLLPIFASVR